ncbi:MAG: hypothetical protein HY820_45525 [Acidobacteria bacterium]|nr:hypothetical protein [Acidobacteriota bacterium]
MTAALPEQCPMSAAAAPAVAFVSTSLFVWSTTEPERFARDFQINDTVYRRLDPEYYAWLRSRMAIAKAAAMAGRLDAVAFEELRVRFNAVHECAIAVFGKARLVDAVRTADVEAYVQPVAEPWRPHRPQSAVSAAVNDAGGFEHRLSEHAISLVDAIRDRALALGWTHGALYQARGRLRFPFGQDYGLVCFIHDKDRLGDVAADAIEIIGPPPREQRSRFYRSPPGSHRK